MILNLIYKVLNALLSAFYTLVRLTGETCLKIAQMCAIFYESECSFSKKQLVSYCLCNFTFCGGCKEKFKGLKNCLKASLIPLKSKYYEVRFFLDTQNKVLIFDLNYFFEKKYLKHITIEEYSLEVLRYLFSCFDCTFSSLEIEKVRKYYQENRLTQAIQITLNAKKLTNEQKECFKKVCDNICSGDIIEPIYWDTLDYNF